MLEVKAPCAALVGVLAFMGSAEAPELRAPPSRASKAFVREPWRFGRSAACLSGRSGGRPWNIERCISICKEVDLCTYLYNILCIPYIYIWLLNGKVL